MWESGISGWQPDWQEGTEQISRHADALASLIGTELTGAWTARIGSQDQWFADMPVVLQFSDGRQLELCWQKFDELSVSWNTIDLNGELVWPAPEIDTLSWRPWAHDALTAMRSARVTNVARTEFLFTTSDVDYPHRPQSKTWLTGGVWFGASELGLHVFNALDENGLSNSTEGQTRSMLAPPYTRIEGRREDLRLLTERERAALEALLAADFPGVEALRQQAANVRADTDGMIVGLVVEDGSTTADVASRTPVEAVVDGGGYDGGLILFVDNGTLSALEYWWVTEDKPDEFPPLSAICRPKSSH